MTPTPATLELARLDGGKATVGPPALEALEQALQGRLLRPGDDGFDDAARIWNGLVRKRPALVVRPAGAADVALAVRFARDHGLLLSVKGGGHNIAGTAIADGGLTLDMSGMREVKVDPKAKTARVGPGCLLQEVDRATQAHGLATVLGFVSETGAAGLTLGGGLGYLTRRFGWTVDNLLEVEIVTADGQVRRANRQDHADLFWALRGGGGNFGIVTEFVYRLHEVGPEITGGMLAWPAVTAEQADAALAAYRRLTAGAPRHLTVFCSFMRAPEAPFVPKEAHGMRIAAFLVCHTGPPEQAQADLAPLTDALGPPAANLVQRRPYTEQQSLVDQAEPKGLHYYWKSEWVSDLSEGLLARLRDLSLENPMKHAQVGLLHIGGALNERAPDDGAVGNRDARYALGVIGIWEPDDPAGASHRDWVRRSWESLRPFSTGGSYINFQTADEGAERIQATYGANFARLRTVKRKYDPDNLFRVNRNLAPADGAGGA